MKDYAWKFSQSEMAKYVEWIVGFYMTLLSFKVQNYRSYWDFTFMLY